MPVTVDTNVLVSALGWDGPEADLLRRAVREPPPDLVLGAAVAAEFAEVGARPTFGFVPREDLGRFLGLVLRRSTVVGCDGTVEAVAADPPDNRVLEAAVAGGCDLVVSGDGHLLDLGSYRGIPVVRAPEALKRLDDPGDEG